MAVQLTPFGSHVNLSNILNLGFFPLKVRQHTLLGKKYGKYLLNILCKFSSRFTQHLKCNVENCKIGMSIESKATSIKSKKRLAADV
jgi:hypothetical protein